MHESYSNDYLAHYGVIGMKWGVRRAHKQYEKATTASQRKEAIDKLNIHKSKASKKLTKYYVKGTKQLNKAVSKRYGLFGDNEKYEKARAKAERTMYKGNKWYNHMEQTFGKQSLVKMSDKDLEMGRRYAKFFEQNAAFTNSKYNSY